MLENYQKDFIKFLLQANALQFGEFKLKSGRLAPYFINASSFNDGELITKLGRFYAAHIVNSGLKDFDTVFGPAYKGIPLAVATSASLYTDFKIKCGYTFDRKEIKQHGDGGKIVGKKITDGTKIVMVDDVITAGTTFLEVIPALRESADVKIEAVIIMVDRQEKGSEKISAVAELTQRLELRILPIVTITQVVEYLQSDEAGSSKLDPQILSKIETYRKEYGA